jgi:hypothetical protein
LLRVLLASRDTNDKQLFSDGARLIDEIAPVR